MEKLQRDDIKLISRHGKLTEEDVDLILKHSVYNNKASWQKFFQLFNISLGIAFTVSGLVFFFAYNWDYLHKFVKIGLTQGVLIATTLASFIFKRNENTRNIILTGAAVIMGVLFAVFGQIYQTGANAYDFFLIWTIFVSLWVLVANFYPLWLLFLVLIDTTFVLYSQQIAMDWSGVFICFILFLIHTSAVVFTLCLGKKSNSNWFLNAVSLASIGAATLGIVIGIFDKYQVTFLALILVAAIVYVAGIWYGLKEKNVFYLSAIPFSFVIIVSAFLIKISKEEMMYLWISILIIVSVTLIVKNLLNLQKKWANEK